jgi:hypothetical protein
MNCPIRLSVALACVLTFTASAQNLTVTSGLQLWLRADAGTSTGANNVVTGWADQSGQDNHAAQADEALAPTLVADALNGHPVLRFDGADDYLEVFDAESLSFTGDLTTFFVARFDDFATFRAVWAKTVSNLPAPTDYYLLPDSGVPRLYRGNGTSSDLGSLDGTALRAETYLLAGFAVEGDQATHYLGGQPTTSGTITAIAGDGDTSLLIGTRADFVTRLKGDLAEMVIYDRFLSAEERAAVVDYLGAKYAIQNLPPAVSLARTPAGPDVPSGTTVTLTATATDPDGTINQVDFLANGAVFATAVAPPFEVRATLETAGSFEFAARAIDDKGSQVTSNPVTFNATSATEPSLTATNNLRLWLRADAGVTAGAGGLVSMWADQSGNGNHATQTEGTFAPAAVADAINEHPVVRFDGSDDYLEVTDSDSVSIAGDITSLFVVRMENFGTFRGVWGKTQLNQPAPNDYYLLPGSGIPRFYRGNAAGSLGFTDGGAAFRVGAYELAGFSASGNSVIHVLNGQVTSTGVINATPADLDTPLRIGTRDDFVTVLHGDLAELLIYDAALDPAELQAAQVYLAEKYALGVVSVSNAPPEVTLGAPTGGAVFQAPTNITVEATSSDPDGSIVRVDFMVNNVLASTSSNAPFSTILVFPAAHDSVLTAVATDNLGRTAISAPVSISVTSTAPVDLPAAANLKVWLRADAGVTATGGGVSAWEDQSGNLHHAAQSAADLQPLLIENALNNRPALRFDGDNDAMSIPHTFTLGMVGDISSFFVVKLDDFETFRAVWAKTEGNQPRPTDYYVLPETGLPRLLRGGRGIGSADGVNPLVAGEYAIVGFETIGSTLRHYLNGAPNGEASADVPLLDTGRPLWIGTRDDSGTRLRGELAELIIYNSALSPADRAAVQAYLSEKYGIPVTEGPPVLSLTRSGADITLSWPESVTGFVLEATEMLVPSGWQPVEGVANNRVTVTASGNSRYFRLAQP